MWIALAMQDIRLRYRGSMLGPFWLTASTIIMVIAMSVIYSRLFNMDVERYLPYLTIGLVFWQFISTVVTEGCQTFTNAEGIIQQVPMPFSIHAYRVVCRNLIVLGHNVVIIPITLVAFHIRIDWRILELVPALTLLAINGVWVSLLFGMVSARFRDVPPIVGNFLQVLFFITPIFWPLGALGTWKLLGDLNPAYAIIDVVRAPLLGADTNPLSWPMFLGLTVVGVSGTFIFFARFRVRIAFWI